MPDVSRPAKAVIGGIMVLLAGTAGVAYYAGTVPSKPAPSTAPELSAAPAPAATTAQPSEDRQTNSTALAQHGNPQDIQPPFFTDLSRSMENAGYSHSAATRVATALANRPQLDTIADLTIAGALPAYIATTGAQPDDVIAELAGFIEDPERGAATLNERFGVTDAAPAARISEKIRAGNHVAAERLIERALLSRFSPSLEAKIFVPVEPEPAPIDNPPPIGNANNFVPTATAAVYRIAGAIRPAPHPVRHHIIRAKTRRSTRIRK